MAQAHAALYGALAEADPLEAAYVAAPRRDLPQTGAKVANDLRRRMRASLEATPNVVPLAAKSAARPIDRAVARPAAEDRLARLRRRFADAAEAARNAAGRAPVETSVAAQRAVAVATPSPVAAVTQDALTQSIAPQEIGPQRPPAPAPEAEADLSSAVLFEDALFIIEDASVSLATAFAPLDLTTTLSIEGAASRAPLLAPASTGLTLAAPVELVGLTVAPVARFSPFATLGREAPAAAPTEEMPAEPKSRARAFRVIRFRPEDLPARAMLEAARGRAPVIAGAASAASAAPAPARSSAKGLLAAAFGGLAIVALVVAAQALLRL